jgi:hypothetical protein
MGLGKSTSTSATKLNGISVQSSVLGVPITIGWGRNRIKCNLIWYGAFTAIAHTTKQSSGKGLGGGSKNTTYTYTASIIMGLSEGPIQGIRTIYRDTSVFTTLAAAGLSLATGTATQAPWGYLTSKFPGQAIGYSGIAYVYAQDYALGDSASLPNHSFEVDFGTQMAGLADADPKDILTDFLTNPQYGLPGWATGLLGDLGNYSLYCRANNLLLSPVLESQATASDFITEIMTATNSEVFWSEGVLKVGTYGDAAASGNGVSWTPDLTPVYDLGEDDFIPTNGNPVQLEIVDQSDAYNIVQVEYLDRANQYNSAIASAQDLANIVQYGKRKQDPTTLHSLCDAQIAQHSSQLLLQRTLYRRELYHFTLPDDFVLLEPMSDYVTLTTVTDELRLDRQLVQIVEIDEDETGNLTFVGEGVNIGTASAALYAPHSASSFSRNGDVAPGSVSAPALINAPTSLTSGDPEVWCAVASTSPNWGGCEVWVSVDDISYSRVGTIDGPARYGVLTTALPSHADPDTSNTLSVDLSASLGILGSATSAEADAGASLCVVGSELVTYQAAALTAANRYDLTALHRGFFGTSPASHASGERFVRLDDAIFKFSYASLNVGSTIYVKLPSFNVYGRALEDIASVTAYSLALAPQTALPNRVSNLRLAAGGTTWTGDQINLVCDSSDRAETYRFDIYKSDGTTLLRSIASSISSATYTAAMAAMDGAQRTYVIDVVASNAAGSAAASSTITVTNAAPAAVTGVSATGGTTTGSVSWSAASDPDLLGYALYFSGTSGFNPKSAGSLVSTLGLTQTIYGLAAGTYYAKVAAFDPWTSDPDLLHFSSEVSFAISAGGGGGAPSGGGGGGGGYSGRELSF